MKKSYIIGTAIIIGAIVLALVSFQASLINYVTITQAKVTDANVQVAGLLVRNSIQYDVTKNLLIFTMSEPQGAEMKVEYAKSKPANFENAEKIVAIGKFDSDRHVFTANELLVKCPSKYEERIVTE